MRIAIIGAGFTGLTTAYRLLQKGHQVTLFEKEKFAGGLSAGFKEKNWDWSLENFYHHLFTDDRVAQELINKLGLAKKLFYLRPKTSIYKNGQTSQFDSPFSVLIFPHLSFPEKLRTGLVTSFLKCNSGWQKLEKVTADAWLRQFYGPKIHQDLWQPLLRAKFGQEAKNISMAWFWARIHKRSTKLGYLLGGFQTLIDNLVEKIKANGGEIHLNQKITMRHLRGGRMDSSKVEELSQFDRIIFTIPTSTFLKIMGQQLPNSYQKKFSQLQMMGVLNLIFILKEKFLIDNTYWLNINELNFPFVAVVEHTNFVNPKHYGNNHILYVGGYYPQNHRYFRMDKEQIFKEFLPYLERIRPDYDFSLFTIYYLLFTNQFAQPIIPVNYSKMIPEMKTPISNVYLANMQMVYPWDRGINFAIELGEKVAQEAGQE